jgi:SRSO17 transposase
MERIGLAGLAPEVVTERLAGHLSPYLKYLGRTELTSHFVAMVKGLLSDLERKSILPICSAFSKDSELRNMQNFMNRSVWDHEGMLGEYQREIGALLSHPRAMITGDSRDFIKKGDMSAGVARQRYGPTGRMENCQASVMVGLAGPNGYGLLDCGLFIPEKWFDEAHAERRVKCHFPERLEFKTRSATLSEMINEAAASGRFKGGHVGVGAAFGGDRDFLDSLPGRLARFAEVPASLQAFPSGPGMAVPERAGPGLEPIKPAPGGGPRSVKELIEGDGAPWSELAPATGARGPIVKADKSLRVIEERNGRPGRGVWLHARLYDDGSIKYALCDESMDAAPHDLRARAMTRRSIERCFGECEDLLGMGHYEVRTWHGWRRHMLLVFIAHLFIHKLRGEFLPNLNGYDS